MARRTTRLMSSARRLPVTAALLLLLSLCRPTESRPSYAARIPNGVSVPAPDGSGAICNGFGHTSCFGGGARNPFGEAFEAAGLEWTTELCQADSDGDGLTNGQELGDPCCVWTPGSDAALLSSAALSHPGFPESTADITAQSSVNCDDLPAATPAASDDKLSKFYNEGEERSSQVFTMEWPLSTQETQYIAFPETLEYDGKPLAAEPIYLVGFSVDVDHMEYVHHFVVLACEQELSGEQLAPFDELTEENYLRRDQLGCSTEIAIWAPGADEVVYPSDVAVPLGPGTAHRAIAIQVHYNNPAAAEGVVDASSLTFHYTSAPREHDMAFLQLGDVLLFTQNAIPPGQASWHVTHRCLIQTIDGAELTAFQHAPHMHFHGRRLWSEKIAAGGAPGADGKWRFASRARAGEPLELIARTDAFDYNLQRPYDLRNTTLRHGDLVSTSCVYNTEGQAEAVAGGLGSQDEMCIHFLSVYPAAALQRGVCIQQDPALAGEWPQEHFSVTDDPSMLSALLAPNPDIQLGYDNLAAPLDLSALLPGGAQDKSEPGGDGGDGGAGGEGGRAGGQDSDASSASTAAAQPRTVGVLLAVAAALMAAAVL